MSLVKVRVYLPNALEISAFGVSKADALANLCAGWGVSPAVTNYDDGVALVLEKLFR